MDFRRLFEDVRQRRGMFLPDDRFKTLVGFVTGCDAASDWELLDGFNDWVALRLTGQNSALHWSAIVAERYIPQMLDDPDAECRATKERRDAMFEELFQLLEDFLARSPDTEDSGGLPKTSDTP